MRHKLLFEDIALAVLLYWRQAHDLSLFQIPVYAHTSDHGFHAHILGREARQIYAHAHGNRAAGEHGHIRTGADIQETYAAPDAIDLFVPAGTILSGLEAFPRDFQEGLMGRFIELRHVLADHALAVELGTDVHKRLLDAPDPIHRNALIAIDVIHGHDFVFQQGVDGARMHFVLVLGIGLTVADSPASRNLVGFIEPAIQNAQV